MSMIAKVLGMSKANLYSYFSSKKDLLYQIHLDDLKRRFIPIIIEEAEGLPDPEDWIVFFLRKFMLKCTSSPASRALVHEVRSLSGAHYYEITSIWRRAYKVVSEVIKELQDLGRARKLGESFLTFLGTGMVFWIVYWFDYSRQTNAEELAESLVKVFLNGLLYSADEKP